MKEVVNIIEKKIKKLAREVTPWVIDIRRDIHAHPEIGMEEVRTGALIAEELRKLDLDEVTTGWVENGVVGILKGAHPGKTVMLRADIDAIPIQENTGLPYASKIPEVMHACGHDGHTAALLGVAKVLCDLKEHIHGTVKFFFQPSEEINDAAGDAIKQGVLENPTVDTVLGMHLWGPMEKGKVGVRKGAIMAAPCIFKFKVIGKGGHGSMPETTIDPIAITCCAINDINYALGRMFGAFDNFVVSFGGIKGGREYNVIPEHVDVIGTVRAFDKELIDKIATVMENVLAGVVKGWGAEYEYEFDSSIPPLINDPKITEVVKVAAEKMVGADNVSELENPTMGAEDFCRYADVVPSSYFFLGISDDLENPALHHNESLFVWDDSVLETAVEIVSMSAFEILDYLNKK